MKDDTLIAVSVKVIEDAEEALNDFLLTLSPGGVVEESEGRDEEWLGGSASIYLEKGEAKEKLKRLEQYLSELTGIWGKGAVLRYEVKEIGDGWKYEYQRFFETKRITDRIVVSPPWEDYPGREGEIVIRILPGAAFGTGTHETTRLSLAAMERVFSRTGIDSILDVGTGSGILAIAGALMGAGRILAVDIDEEAVNSAADNVVRNGVQDIVEIRREGFGDRAGIGDDAVGERFDLVVANITGETIKRLAASLLALTNPGGYLVLSGFLAGEADEILDLFTEGKLFSATKDTWGEWSAVTVEGRAR